MTNKDLHVPVWEKVTLSIKEAAAWSGIGEDKIRRICEESDKIALHIGNHTRVKRKEFEKYIMRNDYI